MFTFVQNHKKIFMIVLFLLVFPSFVLFGISNFTTTDLGSAKVAEVAGQEITQTEWEKAVRNASDNIRNQNPSIDIKFFDSPSFKYATLDSLVRDRVLLAAAAGQRMTISNAQLPQALREWLRQNPATASMVTPEGLVDTQRYEQLAASQGLSPAGLDAAIRIQLEQQQVLAGLMRTNLVNQALANVAGAALQQQRQARVVLFKPADYQGKITPTQEQLQAYYTAHLQQYQVNESAQIQYVTLDLESVKRGVTVSEADLRTYYQQNLNTLGTPEQRRISHILISAQKDDPAPNRAKAKARAEELLAQLKQAPNTFAAVATKNSQDTSSAPQGGDLNWFTQAQGIEPTLTQTAFSLAKEGDLSGVVETDFGYHIVRLTGLKPSSAPPFEQVRSGLEDKYRTQQAQRQFSELADSFTNIVFEQSDSLKPAADQLKLTIQTATVSNPPAQGTTGLLANPKLLQAVFSVSARDKKQNTEAITLNATQLVSARVVSYTPAHAQAFADVQNQVRTAYIAEQSALLARESGQQQLKAWQAAPASATQLPAAITLSRQDPQKQPTPVVEAVLRADPTKLPVFVGVDLGAGGYAIAQVESVVPWNVTDKAKSDELLERYKQIWNSAQEQSYMNYLKTTYNAKILTPKPVGADLLAALQQQAQ